MQKIEITKVKTGLSRVYTAPEISVTDVLVEQNILNNGSATSTLDSMSGEYW